MVEESPTGPTIDPSQEAVGEALTFGSAPLPEREALLRAILGTSPDGLITIDEDGIIQSFNPAAERMFGYDAAEVIGRNVSCLMPSPYREEHDGYLARFRRTGEKRIIGIGREVLGQRRDGMIFPLELAVGEVQAAGRRLFAGFVKDVSARQQSEQRLQELQSELVHVARLSAMGEMASALAHELKPAPHRDHQLRADRARAGRAAPGRGRRWRARQSAREDRAAGEPGGADHPPPAPVHCQGRDRSGARGHQCSRGGGKRARPGRDERQRDRGAARARGRIAAGASRQNPDPPGDHQPDPQQRRRARRREAARDRDQHPACGTRLD